MYSRLFTPPKGSFFLFGPRGVGKTAWLRERLPGAMYFDLLDAATHSDLQAAPQRLAERIPNSHRDWVVIDEVQRVPDLLNEVHRLIESRRLRFALTGSSARKLRRKGVNLLAGRALTQHLHPLTAVEMGPDFDLARAVRHGCLPMARTSENPELFLKSYVSTYMREEVQQEGFARNMASFGRFLEAAAFSQGSILNMASVARDCGLNAKLVEEYFGILDDLLLSFRLPAFTRRAKRRVALHPKFYFFDAGVFQAIRPRGPLDSAEEVRGPALETLFLQHVRAANDYGDMGWNLHYWRTPLGTEVDFVLYGERGLRAFEIKASDRVRSGDLDGLRLFMKDYPVAKPTFVYLGTRRYHDRGIEIVPFEQCLRAPEVWLA